MKVKLLHITPLNIAVLASRKCYDSGEKSDSPNRSCLANWKLGERDKKLIQQIIDSKHHSTIEHITATFDLSGYSRALLQEKSRHRHASVSERSTRYCLGSLKKEQSFLLPLDKISYIDNRLFDKRVEKYIVLTGIEQVDMASVHALENLRKCVVAGIPNDKSKYCLPDSLTSECVFSINFRSFRNWLELRTSPRALWEIRELANMMYNAVPEEYKFMLSDCVKND